ncbi:MAG: LysR family transcriptional regulator [Oceanobacter sp.]
MSKFAQYQAFVAVVDTGSISLAADRLNRTPSALSKQISNLESHLGVQLFDRSNKRMIATQQGKRFYQSSASILKQIDESEQTITANSNAVAGDLRISIPKSLLGSGVMQHLTVFANTYPQTRYVLSVTERVLSFTDSELDFAFRIGSIADSTRLIARELASVRPAFYATPDYLARHGSPTSLANLENHRLAMPPLEALSTEVRAWLKSRRFTFENQKHHLIDDVNAIHTMTLQHGCIGFNLESSLITPLDEGLVTPLFLDEPLPTKTLSLVYRKSPYESAPIEAFKHFMLQAYAKT